jgi:hypothetical protein
VTLAGNEFLVVLSLRIRAVTLNWLEDMRALMIALPILPVVCLWFLLEIVVWVLKVLQDMS